MHAGCCWLHGHPANTSQPAAPLLPWREYVFVLLLRCSGGAFMAGHPLMYKPAYKIWMQQLAEQGIHMRVFAGAWLSTDEQQQQGKTGRAGPAQRFCTMHLKTAAWCFALLLLPLPSLAGQQSFFSASSD
jgi:hypothetical protein